MQHAQPGNDTLHIFTQQMMTVARALARLDANRGVGVQCRIRTKLSAWQDDDARERVWSVVKERYCIRTPRFGPRSLTSCIMHAPA
jgi:hypothetical protein